MDRLRPHRGRPVAGEKWKLNLCRYDYHTDWKEPELSCVAPIAKKKIPHNVLNAKHHENEAYIVAQAGRKSAMPHARCPTH